ncbi:MAG TPA: DinB family protein [Vicinamibacterales bacterium]|nr:DinB family protein [Vicinamibacterales bacterium]
MAPLETSEPARIADQLRRGHDGDPWHGSPVMAILKGVTAEQAAWRPPNGAHSIWELVLHMTGWRNEVAERVIGKPASDPAAGDYPAVGDPTPPRWIAAVDALDAAHRRLVDLTRHLNDEQVFRQTKDTRDPALGTGVTVYELFHGIVQHDAYHAGQIALLKRIGSWGS